MDSITTKMFVKSKVWIEDENGNILFGSGRMQLLNAIEDQGSILAASKNLKMSYRAAWGKIKATEQSLGQPILNSSVGGTSGGGSDLTPLGKLFSDLYSALQLKVKKTSDEFFENLLFNGLKNI